MALEFSGEIADLYHRYRHGYHAEPVDLIADHLAVGSRDLLVDLGCGTGQLTIPLARRMRAVVGVDPEPDMLEKARGEADRAGLHNVGWMLGSDLTLPALRVLFGDHSVTAITIAQALHWMDHRLLFAAARPLLREGGGIAIIANGVPLWLHDTIWSQEIRVFLEQWLDTSLTARCGTDVESQVRYAEDLKAAGYAVTQAACDHVVALDFEHLAGGLLSALPASKLPDGPQRQAFLRDLRSAVGSVETFQEPVHVNVLIGHL